jgi:hypothetical protein
MRRHHRIAGVSLVVLSAGVFIAGASSGATIWLSATSSRTSLTTNTLAPSWRAIWPVTPTTSGYASPVVAARNFAVSLLHMNAPVVGTFLSRGASTGVVGVRSSVTSLATNVHVTRFAGAAGWWVVSCTTRDIDLISPLALAGVTSPLTLTGRSLAYEAVVNISLYIDGRKAALVSATTMGGASQMAPFRATLRFPQGLQRYGTVIMYSRSAKDGSTVVATARRIFLK